ncbi:Receptor-type tyrosine-protein phosphatase S [Liparis tanakae]|uniref:Receptor-type tyrosine-protein phosphatase S n=1 Tax=Liparis tanakae TaxID=230148 RepID=A0A4Z2EDA7_9TELE|nr:Receptor-type tyrosine-protein phosphatase S [Liparis tanakae]
MVIGGLKPDTTYSITVAAYTTKGDGARSKPKLVVTKGAGMNTGGEASLTEASPTDGGLSSPPDGGLSSPPDGGLSSPHDGGLSSPPDGGFSSPPDGAAGQQLLLS